MARLKLQVRDLVRKPTDVVCLAVTAVVLVPVAVVASPFILVWSLVRCVSKCGDRYAEKFAVSPH